MRAVFPLTPALSRREREKRSQRFGTARHGSSWRAYVIHEAVQRLFLLLGGEGQDEGERSVKLKRIHCPNPI
jgi:hypothetical protein